MAVMMCEKVAYCWRQQILAKAWHGSGVAWRLILINGGSVAAAATMVVGSNGNVLCAILLLMKRWR